MKCIRRSLAAACLAATSAYAALDLNSDSVPDVWALVYNVGAIDMAADSDGDGLSNAKEAIAGTDPFSPGNTVRITSVTNDVYGVHLTFPTIAGKRYQVQSTASLSSPSWANEGTALAGLDGNVTADVGTPGASNKFFRISVSDLDSDGDGVSDWEEIKLGLDPNTTHSNGSNGSNDLENATQALTAPSVVTVTAVDNEATEPASGVQATDTAAFVITRTGGLKPINVQFNTNGSAATSGTDYTGVGTSVAMKLGVKSVTVPVEPLADSVTESPEGVLLNLVAGTGYTLGAQTTAAVIIQDRTTANGNGLRGDYWNYPNLSTTVTPTYSGAPILTRIDPTVNFQWASGVSPGPGVVTNYYATRWTGEVLPEFSQIYTFKISTNYAGRLWVNGTLVVGNWAPSAVKDSKVSGTIELQAGVRYPVVFEFYNDAGSGRAELYWQSANQAEQIIPTARMFANTPPRILEPLALLLIKGSGVTNFQVNASGGPTSYAAANLPPGWTINGVTGLITGNANTAGEWDVPVMATNAAGSGSGIVTIRVIETGGAITRDVWSGVSGTAVSDIPLTTNPTTSANVSALEGPQDTADNYGARIRGYVTAPATGVYKFFLTASNAAELWISNDDEPVNSFKRAEVLNATGYREWTHASAGASSLLWLDAGKRYFVEVRHKAGTGSDHVSVGWLKPGEGGANPAGATSPTEVVPGFVLSPYVAPAPISGESTLYVASLTAQGTSQTSGFGSATLRLSADETQAILSYTYGNLTTPVTQKHIHSDAFGSHPQGEIIFDIDVATPNPDGSYTWDLSPTGTFTTRDQILAAIKQGTAYLNVHTATYPAGEIRGNFRLAAASQTFTPPAPQPWSDPESAASPESHLNRAAGARFLVQATFGVSGVDANANTNPDDIEAVQSLGFEGWIDNQFTKPATFHYPYVFADRNQTSPNNSTYPGTLTFNAWWKSSITGQDQLRQRVAFALSEIMVTSEAGPLDDRADALSDYYDMLLANSFGNVKDLLVATTLHPAMGRYLDMLGNRKPNLSTGRIPNENYAREILQLFSIGLNRMHPDGSLILNSKGELVPTYDQDEIIGFAHAFTGWYYHVNVVPPAFFPTSMNAAANWIESMTEVPQEHFTGRKRILNNVVLPGLPVLPSMGNQVLDPYASHSTAQIQTPEYQALPAQELQATHEAIFRNPNTGPFICRQLIQRLVTSTPSRGYVYRVVSKFNDNGSGVRGDMKAVIKAILLDYEARSAIAAGGQGFGKQREPVARITAIARAFPSPPSLTGTYTQSGTTITVTTPTPHLFPTPTTNSPSMYLDFNPATSGDPGQPDDATYTAISSPFSATMLTFRAKSFEGPINYTRGNGITKFTGTTDTFSFNTGDNIYLEFLTGTPTVPANGADLVEFRSSDRATIVFANPTTKRGTYAQAANSTTLTVTITAHGYAAGSTIHLEAVSGATPPATQTYTIATVAANTFTVTTATAPTAAQSGTIFATPPADLVATTTGTANLTKAADAANRSGTVTVTYSDWNMDTTNTDLNQTPMQSPTVFNFFLPDYQFPGVLSNAGLITPEFELTAETSVIRQANFIYNGLFTTALGTTGLESFKSGGRDIIVDLRPWMGTGPGGLPWVHNNNLNALIDELNTRLTGGQLPPAAKTLIRNYVTTQTLSATPTTTQLRDRVRSVVHFIVSSPDFTIQK